MAGIRGRFIIFEMARYAGGLKTRHLAVRVTGLTIELRMPSNQRESRRRMLRLHRQTFIPAIRRMALFAAIAELPSVHVRMASSARRLCLGEDQSRMAR